MRSFKDLNGREWVLELNVDALDRVREATGTNLLSLFENECALVGQVLDDPVFLAKVIWPLIETRAAELSVDQTTFRRALAADACEEAADALIGAVLDFFPSRRRAVLTKMVETLRTVVTTQMDRAAVALSDPLLSEKITAAMAADHSALDPTAGTDSAGTSPALSA